MIGPLDSKEDKVEVAIEEHDGYSATIYLHLHTTKLKRVW